MISEGLPPLWSPPSPARKLEPDSGARYVDQNAARNPKSPLEPLFRAVYAHKPDFDIREIDVVTDRNNVRKLLRFIQASSNECFEIQVEIAGGTTALFTRVEPETKQTIHGFHGFGHNFEKAYTKSLVGSTGYYRVISYMFGNMKWMVRNETDGCVDEKARPIATEGAEHLSDILSTLSISTSNTAAHSPQIVVKAEGRTLDPSSMLEIKTRAATRTLDMGEVMPQLWISQTPKLAVGYHKHGIFQDVRLRDMDEAIQRWQTANVDPLARLVCLVRKIIAAVKITHTQRAVVKYDGGMTISLHQGNQQPALPDDLYSKWDGERAEAGTRQLSPASSASEQLEPTNQHKGKEVKSDPQNTTRPQPLSNVLYADVIDFGSRNGFRHFFRRLPTQLADYRVLCQSLKTLQVDVLAGRNMRDVMKDMRKGIKGWDPEERTEIPGQKALARDSAFRLMFIFLTSESGSEPNEKNQAFNATVFVVSHRSIFKYRARKMVREAFDSTFWPTDKQRTILNNSSAKDAGCRESQDEDVTTEAEPSSYDFDSDYSF